MYIGKYGVDLLTVEFKLWRSSDIALSLDFCIIVSAPLLKLYYSISWILAII